MNRKNILGVIAALGILVVFFLAGSSFYPFGGVPNSAATELSTNAGSNLVLDSGAGDLVLGADEEVKVDSLVTFNYIGKLSDGTVFDASENHGGAITIDLSESGLIRGFAEGILGMRAGEKKQIVIPPELGYGSEDVRDQNGNVVIPGNSTLVFEVEIVSVSLPVR